MDAIILMILIILTIIFFRRFRNVVYIICIIDIFLRIVTKLEEMLDIELLSNIVNKYLPNSIIEIINTYSTGIINKILIYLYLFIYVMFNYNKNIKYYKKR